MNLEEKVDAMLEKVWEEWRCIECGRGERDRTALMERDENGDMWRCIECGRVTKDAKMLTKKIGEVWKCIMCGKLAEDSKAKARLRRHVETHIMDISHSCTVCGHTSTTTSALEKHMAKKHPELKIIRDLSAAAYPCDLCGKRSKSAKGLANHKWKYHRGLEARGDVSPVKAFMCNICGTGSKTSKSLYNHKWKYHRNMTTAVSSESDIAPEAPVAKKTEVRVETSIEEADEKAEALMARIGDTLYCGDCGKSMPKEKKWQMRRHVEIHLSGMVFSCELCGKQSKSTHGLYQHKMKRHPELKLIAEMDAEFKCNICGKGSKTSKGLSNHKWKYHRGMDGKTDWV